MLSRDNGIRTFLIVMVKEKPRWPLLPIMLKCKMTNKIYSNVEERNNEFIKPPEVDEDRDKNNKYDYI